MLIRCRQRDAVDLAFRVAVAELPPELPEVRRRVRTAACPGEENRRGRPMRPPESVLGLGNGAVRKIELEIAGNEMIVREDVALGVTELANVGGDGAKGGRGAEQVPAEIGGE